MGCGERLGLFVVLFGTDSAIAMWVMRMVLTNGNALSGADIFVMVAR